MPASRLADVTRCSLLCLVLMFALLQVSESLALTKREATDDSEAITTSKRAATTPSVKKALEEINDDDEGSRSSVDPNDGIQEVPLTKEEKESISNSDEEGNRAGGKSRSSVDLDEQTGSDGEERIILTIHNKNKQNGTNPNNGQSETMTNLVKAISGASSTGNNSSTTMKPSIAPNNETTSVKPTGVTLMSSANGTTAAPVLIANPTTTTTKPHHSDSSSSAASASIKNIRSKKGNSSSTSGSSSSSSHHEEEEEEEEKDEVFENSREEKAKKNAANKLKAIALTGTTPTPSHIAHPISTSTPVASTTPHPQHKNVSATSPPDSSLPDVLPATTTTTTTTTTAHPIVNATTLVPKKLPSSTSRTSPPKVTSTTPVATTSVHPATSVKPTGKISPSTTRKSILPKSIKNDSIKKRLHGPKKNAHTYKPLKRGDHLLAVVITKKGGFKGRRLNGKAIAKIMRNKLGVNDAQLLEQLTSNKISEIKISRNNSFVLPAGTYYFPNPIRVAGFTSP